MEGWGGRLQGGTRRLVVTGALLGALLFGAGCGGGDDDSTASRTGFVAAPSDTSPEGEWAHPNGDLANTRNVPGEIDVSTVSRLRVAWTVPITAGSASTPIVVDRTVYAQDLDSNVRAIDLASGEVKWEARFDAPTLGPNGVAVGEGRVYGGTGDGAFALDQATGRELWSLRVTRNEREGVDMAPGYKDGIVYISTVPRNVNGAYEGDGVGILHALDAASGRRIWSFKTVPLDLWDPRNVEINSGGGLWHPPAFDDEGSIYVDVAGPGPWPGTERFPWGQSRPGPNLFTNSLVKLDAASGEVEWHHQVLPHGIYGWDLQLPPVVTEEDGRDFVLAAGTLGYVFAFDAQNGDMLWRRQVGLHNGHDRDNELALAGRFERLSTPVTVWPGVFGGVATQMAVQKGVIYAPVVDLPTTFESQERNTTDAGGGRGQMVALAVDNGDVEWTQRFPSPIYGAATVTNSLLFTTTSDGSLYALDVTTGEIVWREELGAATEATVAIAGDTLLTAAGSPGGGDGRAQIVAYRIGATGRPAQGGEQTAEAPERQTNGGAGAERQGGGAGGGGEQGGGAELAAGREVFTTNCAGCHTLAAANASGSVGPDLDALRPDEALVRTVVTEGRGAMPAFGGRLDQAQIDAVAAYVASVAGGGGGGGGAP